MNFTKDLVLDIEVGLLDCIGLGFHEYNEKSSIDK